MSPWCNYPLAFVIVNPIVNLFNVHHTATEQINKTLLQRRCNNAWYYSFSILKKTHLNWILYIFLYILPYIQWLLSIENSCHLHCHTKYIWSNVATMLLQRLSQTSPVKLSSTVVKTLCVNWDGLQLNRWCKTKFMGMAQIKYQWWEI